MTWKGERYIFVTTNPEVAKVFGNIIFVLKVDIQNPAKINYDLVYQFADTLDGDLYRTVRYVKNYWELFDGAIGYKFIKYLKNKGYDSAEFEEEMHTYPNGELQSGTTYVLFSKSQIKR